MDRIERTEIFGSHIISATIRSARQSVGWEVDVAALPLGGGPQAPLLRFSPARREGRDAREVLEAALTDARRELAGARSS